MPGKDVSKTIAKDPNRKYSYLLMVGHVCSDVNQGALAAVLPFLVAANGYSYATVAMLLFAANMASAVVQPLFGWLGDRKARPWFMAVAIALACGGMAGVGLFQDFTAVAASAMVSGVGVAMFHPEGGRLANLVAGRNKGQGMSIFAVGGNIGFCIGPMVAAAAVTAFGLQGTLVFLIPIVPFCVAVMACNAKLASFGVSDPHVLKRSGGHERWGLFSLVLGVLSLRSVVFYGLNAFVPLFVIAAFGATEGEGSLLISLFALFGAVATVCSGKAADRIGSINLAVVSMGASALLVVAFSLGLSFAFCAVVVCLVSAAVTICNPTMVATGQDYVPHHLGMASGLTYGVTVCIGGVMSPVLGLAGDAWGLQSALLIVAGVAALACALAFVLKVQDARLPHMQQADELGGEAPLERASQACATVSSTNQRGSSK